MNYYNEHDPKAAAWIRELIAKKIIPEGVVDERDIQEIRPSDLAGFVQCHFFAGIGGWPHALTLAGWPSDRPVWTGSCPCQPFSAAGKGLGTSDARHLWPVFAELIRACKPPTVFGEQVASKSGREWLAGVFADLEGMGYSRAGADLCAAGVGAPHIRQRLFWVANAFSSGECGRNERGLGAGGQQVAQQEDGQNPANQSGDGCEDALRLGESDCSGREQGGSTSTSVGHRDSTQPAGGSVRLADPGHELRGGWTVAKESAWAQASNCSRVGESSESGLEGAHSNQDASQRIQLEPADTGGRASSGVGDTVREGREGEPLGLLGPGDKGHWSRFDILPCLDGKSRRVESGTFPLAHGIPGRVGLLRGYGNAIVPQVAQAFIEAFQSCRE